VWLFTLPHQREKRPSTAVAPLPQSTGQFTLFSLAVLQ
jgi:hypothetical protein